MKERLLKPVMLKLDKETFYEEDRVPDYGILDDTIIKEVIRRLVSEDVIEVE